MQRIWAKECQWRGCQGSQREAFLKTRPALLEGLEVELAGLGHLTGEVAEGREQGILRRVDPLVDGRFLVQVVIVAGVQEVLV